MAGSQLGSVRTSTYKLVAVISGAETIGHYDCLNAYDRALLSLGLYHCTLGTGPSQGTGKYNDGEACALFAYLNENYTQKDSSQMISFE